ncbi:hypothetical protein F2P56_023332 [Juglans regia]|uniref:Uncharacterized protein LOC109003566 n=2 Tax=Juglans regia TaxID=51240 RepID=A0A2I4G057_JUGRE|nr:uncharacterized protein LOC109003566 [Juglans regia]XP_018837288.1 uncharacterized protein LOC109003566 [Juglans regia]XP_018837289.1 uncharacterized protein LOC109003566 [Juglans regia]XP_018837290.1 uncharacterized protein LOC109003566 [Juglans regia]XP_018837291.1 uncharacterized protein LOC109003566 [Juglans regia]XP_018837292.1 uncharacterized protein LOC109003566 [Juglans regia]XP_035550284.1 uncharacterized protein LOC109003566 [Juglans regia]XP_035550285.1 uncharacterized protein 
MVISLSSWYRYLGLKVDYSVSLVRKPYKSGQMTFREAIDAGLKNFFLGKLTYFYWNSAGEEMAPTIGARRGTLLVRKGPTYVFTGDVVLLRDPMKSHNNFLVRRLAGMGGYHEMVPKDEKEEPFVLEKNQCWVSSDNENLKPEEANDSRNFGPVHMTDIVGRVIYSMRTAEDHGPVQNSNSGMKADSEVLEIELDLAEMKIIHLGKDKSVRY